MCKSNAFTICFSTQCLIVISFVRERHLLDQYTFQENIFLFMYVCKYAAQNSSQKAEHLLCTYDLTSHDAYVCPLINLYEKYMW